MSRILIVEDSSSVAQHLSEILQVEQHQTQIALSGHDALRIIKEQSFEIILLDLVLPDMSGIQILKKLRQKFTADILPIIVISSITSETEIEKALQLGANDFIQKPFSELILKVKTKNLLHLQHKTTETNLNNKVMQDIFESTPVISFLVDKDVRILKTNNSGQKFFEKAGSELNGMLAGNAIQCLNAVTNNGRCGQTNFCADCVIRNAVNYTFKTQKPIYRNEGSFHVSNEKNIKAMDFLISTSPIVYNGINTVLLSIEDITNERLALREAQDTSEKLAKAVLDLKLLTKKLNLANTKLSEQEQQFRIIFNAFNVGIGITNPEGKYIMMNDWWINHLGYTHEELSEMDFTDITYPDDIDISSDRFNKLIKKEITQYRTEKRFVRKNKSLFWGDLSVSAIFDSEGDVTHVVGVISDITQLKEARESLLKSEAALLEAQKIGNTAHWEFDLISGKFFWSEQAFKILDLKPKDFTVTYKNVMQLLHPNDMEIFEQAHQDCIYKKIPI
ncbi:MAG: PAS domain S-box protein, partial [Bacteroidales bacterium]|nr:PAS domain S-box protein [Bacteroidales bacterium]